MTTKSILFVGGLIDVGGAGKMLKYVANVCADYFPDVYVLSCLQKERPIVLKSQVRYLHTHIPVSLSVWNRLRMMRDIRNTVKELSPDIVCAFTSEISTLSRFATIGINTRFLSAERGDPYTLPWKWKILTRFAYGLSDACIFQLKDARDFYNKKIQRKSYIIPNPFLLPCRVEPYYGERRKTIVGAGRFQPEKGFDILIEAFALVNKKFPEFKLIIYGEGPLLKDYKEQIKRHQIEDKVVFPGYVQNVAEVIRQDGIFVLPSLYEGIPNVLIEALSVGIPSVATNCSPGGPDFLMENGKRGIITPIGDSTAMANAITRLIEDKDLYQQMEQAGPEIRGILAPDAISRKWYDAFCSVLGQ